MKFLTLYILLFLGTGALSQEKVSNTDLRKQYDLFSMKSFKKKNTKEIKMTSSNAGQYNLLLTENGKVVKQRKVSFSEAQKLDENFVDKFISFKYLMKSQNVKKCKDSYYLNLRGEELVICQSEKDKNDEMSKFTEKLMKQFL